MIRRALSKRANCFPMERPRLHNDAQPPARLEVGEVGRINKIEEGRPTLGPGDDNREIRIRLS